MDKKYKWLVEILKNLEELEKMRMITQKNLILIGE